MEGIASENQNWEDLFGFINLLTLLRYPDSVIEWVQNIPEINNLFEDTRDLKNKIFHGYKLFVLLSWSKLVKTVISTNIFDLDEDLTFLRWFYFVEMPLEDIPVTCEKTSLYIGLMNLKRAIQRSSTFSEFTESLPDLVPFLELVNEIIRGNMESEKFEISRLLQVFSVYCLFTYFYNANKNQPLIFNNTLDDFNYGHLYLNGCFEGFFLCLNYLWDRLVDHGDVKQNVLVAQLELIRCGRTLRRNLDDYYHYLAWRHIKKELESLRDDTANTTFFEDFGFPAFIRNDGTPDEREEEREREINRLSRLLAEIEREFGESIQNAQLIVEHLRLNLEPLFASLPARQQNFLERIPYHIKFNSDQSEKESLLFNNIWDVFDNLKSKLRPLVTQYEDEIPRGFQDPDIIHITENPSKELVREYCQDIEPVRIEESDSEEDIIKKLKAMLFWYGAEVIDGINNFSGVPAFVTLLEGQIVLLRRQEVQEEIQVKVFKHTDEKSISLSILKTAYSSISDYSGWILFSGCATYGYSGSGPSMYRQALETIQTNDHLINCQMIEVPRTLFTQFLAEINPREVWQLNLREDISKRQVLLDHLRGKIFEAFIFKWVHYTNRESRVFWNEVISNQEIDVYSESNDRGLIKLYECKISLHGDDLGSVLRNLVRKRDVLTEKYPIGNIQSHLVVWENVNDKRKRHFTSNEIIVIANFRDTITHFPNIFTRSTQYQKFLDDASEIRRRTRKERT